MKFKAFNEEEFKRDTDTIDLTNLEIVEEAIATLQESYFNKNDGFRRIEKVSLLAIHLLQQENQQLKEVIKEVREEIEKSILIEGVKETGVGYYENIKANKTKLLQILDKAKENK